MTLSIMTLGMMTFSIIIFSHGKASLCWMLDADITDHNIQSLYADCHYAKCHYAECYGATENIEIG